jgi:hypothetical protein
MNTIELLLIMKCIETTTNTIFKVVEEKALLCMSGSAFCCLRRNHINEIRSLCHLLQRRSAPLLWQTCITSFLFHDYVLILKVYIQLKLSLPVIVSLKGIRFMISYTIIKIFYMNQFFYLFIFPLHLHIQK